MLVLWYADLEGDSSDLAKANELLDASAREAGTAGYRRLGPYLAQRGADYLWVFEMERFEDLNRMGRRFLKKVEEAGLTLTPVRYELGVTPEEFWG
jgi:hypothetical protein